MSNVPLVCSSVVVVSQAVTIIFQLKTQRKLLEILKIRGEMVDVQAKHITFLNSVLARLDYGHVDRGELPSPGKEAK